MAYADCCKPLHTGQQVAATAEAVMRSRYAAFTMQLADYLTSTWHPSTRPAQIEFTQGQQWLLLKIVDSQTDGDSATVEFTARSRISGGKSHILHEHSRFVREGNRWLYVDGEIK